MWLLQMAHSEWTWYSRDWASFQVFQDESDSEELETEEQSVENAHTNEQVKSEDDEMTNVDGAEEGQEGDDGHSQDSDKR